jgi:hypothetical protein
MREPGSCLPAESHADGLQRGDQPLGLAGVCSAEFWHTLGEDPAPAARIPADEFAHRELEADRARAPGKVGQVELIATMDRGRQRGQPAAGAVVLSWTSTYAVSMVILVRRTERVGGSRFVTNVWSSWRSWLMISIIP